VTSATPAPKPLPQAAYAATTAGLTRNLLVALGDLRTRVQSAAPDVFVGFRARRAGVLSIRVIAVSGKRRTAAATGMRRFTRPGQAFVRVRPTRAGRALLRRKGVRLVAYATFTRPPAKRRG
jgi:hypothetical protein